MADNDRITDFVENVLDAELLRVENIPKIDLYMEQMISFLEEEIGGMLRRSDESVFTKTMVNNYTKFGILPRPDKKKYNRRHMIYLIYIFLLKQTLSIQDVKLFFSLLDEGEDGEKELEELYPVFRDMIGEFKSDISEFIGDQREKIKSRLAEKGIESEKVNAMMFISTMAYEANVYKMICERLLDELGDDGEKDKSSAKDEKAN